MQDTKFIVSWQIKQNMSFRNISNLAEYLKLLGYPSVFPQQIFCNNFGTFNTFCIVVDILQWLAGLIEPGAVLAGGVDTEEERVLFIRSVTEFFLIKAGVKLNPRKLYAASVATVGELQKITQLLIAPTENLHDKDEDESNYRELNQVDIGDKMDDLRRARELSAELTQRGAVLSDLLAKEMLNKETRIAQANRPMELDTATRALKNAIAAAQLKLQSNRAQLENARIELNALNSKVQRKRSELERTKQRLEALQKIRPAHMQEFEECEQILKELFQEYFKRLHVRDALRAQFESQTKQITPIPSPIPQKSIESSIPPLLSEDLLDNNDNEDEELDSGAGMRPIEADVNDFTHKDLMLKRSKMRTSTGKRPGTATSRARPTTGRSRRSQAGGTDTEFGKDNMRASIRRDLAMDDDSSFGSSDSDLGMDGIISMSGLGMADTQGRAMLKNINADLSHVDDDEFDLNSIDDISISKITGELPIRPKTANKAEHHSDEDF